MWRQLSGIAVGVIVGVCFVALVEALGRVMFPLPVPPGADDPEEMFNQFRRAYPLISGIGPENTEALTKFMSNIPFGAKTATVIGWGIGVFTGSLAAILVGRHQIWPGLIAAGLILIAGAYTMAVIPHPFWMVSGLPAVAVVGVYLAVWLGGRKATPAPTG